MLKILHKLQILDKFLRKVETFFDKLHRVSIYSKLDLNYGYHKMQSEEDIDETRPRGRRFHTDLCQK